MSEWKEAIEVEETNQNPGRKHGGGWFGDSVNQVANDEVSVRALA